MGGARWRPSFEMPKKTFIKRYFITGLLIWVPLGITVWVLDLLVSTMDQTLLLLPEQLHTEKWLGVHIPGLGVVLTLLIVFVTGLLAANFIGQRLVRFWEGVLARIPVVKSIYNGVKQVTDTLFSSTGQAFRKALLVQYPREGSWTIAFQTGSPGGDVVDHLHGEYVSVYVPTTPNPTSGFFLMMPQADVIELDMSVDEALKYIVSMGVVRPPAGRRASGKRLRRNPPRRRRPTVTGSIFGQPCYPIYPVIFLCVPNTAAWSAASICADRHPLRLGASPPRPRRGDLHRPARPRGSGADGVRSRQPGDVRDRREPAQGVRGAGDGHACGRAPRAP